MIAEVSLACIAPNLAKRARSALMFVAVIAFATTSASATWRQNRQKGPVFRAEPIVP
jgi:hypothetical protein